MFIYFFFLQVLVITVSLVAVLAGVEHAKLASWFYKRNCGATKLNACSMSSKNCNSIGPHAV